MEYKREKDFQQKATYDTFEEFYTSFDLSVEEKYDSGQCYPFDYPLRWLNDPSMNKRIGIRKLLCRPTSHVIKLTFACKIGEEEVDVEEEDESTKKVTKPILKEITETIEITHADSFIKVLSHMRNTLFSFEEDGHRFDFCFEYSSSDNNLEMVVLNEKGEACDFAFVPPPGDVGTTEIEDFLRFLNQDTSTENIEKMTNLTNMKHFTEVWDRDLIFFHTSFSTSSRKIVGIDGDFYTSPTVLYPPPTNESTFYLRFTSDGKKNILIRHCVFMVQLVFIVNFMKTKIL